MSSPNWSNSSWLSFGSTTAVDDRPCFVLFRAERALPSSVRGPVECFAFSRLAVIWAADILVSPAKSFAYRCADFGGLERQMSEKARNIAEKFSKRYTLNLGKWQRFSS